MKTFTGVGSRDITTQEVRNIKQLSLHLGLLGYTLRSGKANGADNAFQSGLLLVEKEMGVSAHSEIYIPWPSFNKDVRNLDSRWDISLEDLTNTTQAEEIVSRIHPAWEKLSQGARKLHTRNVYQVLGRDLESPSDFLVCCSDPVRGGVKGGTNTAYQVALQHDVPVFNLREKGDLQRIVEFVRSLHD